LALLNDIGQVMRDASICGLGQTAASAIGSAIKALQPFGVRQWRLSRLQDPETSGER
jgi:NADH-quinone oxidoreductase subunit F